MSVTIQTLGPGIAAANPTTLNPVGVPATGQTFGGGAPAPVATGPTFGGGAEAPHPVAPVVTTGPTFGGGAPAPVPAAPAPTPATAPAAPARVSVNDGYSTPIQRDTTGLSGGTPGNVNTTLYTRTTVGKDVKAFEWSALHVLDNFSDAGENVALYTQANKFGAGPTWGACIEVCDTSPGDVTGMVGMEVDLWATGPDNGSRIGIDVTLGDAKKIRGLGASDVIEGTAAIRIGSSNNDPKAKWLTGIDMSGANVGTAIKLAAGQKIVIGDTVIGATKDALLTKVALGVAIVALVLPFIRG